MRAVGPLALVCLLEAGVLGQAQKDRPAGDRKESAKPADKPKFVPPPVPAAAIEPGSSTVRLPATRQWVDSGLEVLPGMLVDVNATGEILLNGEQRTGPEGVAAQGRSGLPLVSGRRGAVVVKVKYPNGYESNVLAIGRGMQFRVEEHEFGRLYVGINAEAGDNNTGQFTVMLRWR